MIVYAPSYAGLVQALKIKKIEELKVITSNFSIKNFCEKFNIKCHYFERMIAINRKEYKENLEKIKLIAQVYHSENFLFCFYSRDLFGLCLMYRLAENNTITFHNKDFIYKRLEWRKLFTNFKFLKDLIFLKSITKLPISIFKLSETKVFFGISPERLKLKFNSNVNLEYENEILKINQEQIFKNINIKANSVIFVDQGNSIFDVPDSIIALLKSYDKRVFVKQHPNFNLSNNKLNEFELLDKNIPIELMISNQTILIGIASTILFDQDFDCEKISLINKVNWKESYTKNNLLSQIKTINTIKILQ
jgi:hypothetical protein